MPWDYNILIVISDIGCRGITAAILVVFLAKAALEKKKSNSHMF